MKISDSILDLCVGDIIGEGYSRTVYEWLPDPSMVLKVAKEDNMYRGISSNILEFELWEWVAFGETHKKAKKWLAPVHRITKDGRCMLMAKTEPLKTSELPEKVPCWMTDIKQENVGLYEGRVVIHDYALNLVTDKGLSKKMRKAVWE